MAAQTVHIGTNPGPQSRAFASTATITVYGGQAGGGKTHLALLRTGVHADRFPGYEAIIFRREMKQALQAGGLWEESTKMFPVFGARANFSDHFWRWSRKQEHGSLIQFKGIEHDKDLLNFQGAQIAEFVMDEATHFTESQFWWLFSRLRSSNCKGFTPRCLLTCNPDPDSWVRSLIDWWIGEDGLAIPERAGKRRFFVRDGDVLLWGDTPDEVLAQSPTTLRQDVKSLRFIPAALSDNPKGDPNYRSMLLALPRVERERLLGGNWNVRPVAGSYFRRQYFEVLPHPPIVVKRVRAWDLAATEPSADNKDPDWTVGVKLALLADGRYMVEHVVRERITPAKVDALLQATAEADGLGCIQAFWQDPAQAGKAQRDYIVTLLRGYRVRFIVASEDKETYAGPVSSDAENGKICMLRGAWNEPFLRVLEGFPVIKKKDDVDALSRAHREFTKPAQELKSEHIRGL